MIGWVHIVDDVVDIVGVLHIVVTINVVSVVHVFGVVHVENMLLRTFRNVKYKQYLSNAWL